MFNLLKTLCELPGPGGDEAPVQNYLQEHWHERVESIQRTRVGNVIARVGGHGPRLVMAAHADEVAFVVKHISSDGYLWLTTNQRDIEQRPSMRSGYFLPLGFPALILTAEGQVEGLFATLTGQSSRRHSAPGRSWSGATSLSTSERVRLPKTQKRGVQVGDRVIWNPPVRRMGDFIYGKAMDDRALLAIMDRLLDVLDRAKLAYELTFASTIQEEVGLVGADSLTADAAYDLGIALDVGLVGDVPGVDPRDASARLGGGPMIVHKDALSYNRPLTLALVRAAQAAHIPVQQAIFSQYGSDAGALIRHGVPAALVCIPTRYTHSPFEMVHLGDAEQTVQLLKAFLETPP